MTLCHVGVDHGGVPAGSKPSYDDLAVLVAAQAEEIARLKARIAELEARLN